MLRDEATRLVTGYQLSRSDTTSRVTVERRVEVGDQAPGAPAD